MKRISEQKREFEIRYEELLGLYIQALKMEPTCEYKNSAVKYFEHEIAVLKHQTDLFVKLVEKTPRWKFWLW